MLARCLLLVVILTAIAVDAHTQELVSMREILDGDSHYYFAVSPNGKMLANVTTDSSRTEIRIRNIDTLEISQRIKFPEGVATFLEWTNNRRILIGTADGLYSISPTGASVQTILKGRGDEDERLFGDSVFQDDLDDWRFRNRLKDDDENVLIESFDGYGFSRLHKLNLFTGVMTDVVSGRDAEIKRWFLTPGGKPVIGVREKRGSFQFLVQDPTSGEWRDHDGLHAGGPVSFNYEAGTRYRRSHAPFSIGKDGRTVYVTALNTEGRYELQTYDLATGAILGVAAKDARYDVGTDVSDTSLYLDDADYRMLGSSYEQIIRRYDLADDRLATAMNAVNQLLPSSSNTLYNWPDDLTHIIVRAESPVLYGSWYRYTPATNKLTLIEASRVIDDSLMVPSASAGQITADDGTVIDTILLLPHPNATPRGVIIALRTKAGQRQYFKWDSELYYFASRGYAVVQFNGRGSVGYGRDFFYSGLENSLAKMIDDTVAVARWAEATGLDGGNGTFAFGLGYGASSILSTAMRHPDLFDAIVTLGAAIDLRSLKQWADKEDSDELSAYLQAIEDSSGNSSRTLSQLSTANNLDLIKTPWQVFHQEFDPVFDGDDMKKLIGELKKSNEDVVHRNIGTGLSVRELDSIRKLFAELTVKFYARHADTGGAIALD